MESVPCEISGRDAATQVMIDSARKRGRPRLTVTKDVVERRRLSKQRSDSRRNCHAGLQGNYS